MSHNQRFKRQFAQKIHFHNYIDNLRFGRLHVVDTKYGHSKNMIKKHKVFQLGYDFDLPSTKYLKETVIPESDVIWLDYCCTPTQPFVLKDMKLCTSKWVFVTFSLRGCKWKSQIKYIRRGTPYKIAWTYKYNDTSPMIVVAYYKNTPPKKLVNPVGQMFKYKWKNKWYTRQCKKLLLPPSDDSCLYLDLGDSNEPMNRCKLVRGSTRQISN